MKAPWIRSIIIWLTRTVNQQLGLIIYLPTSDDNEQSKSNPGNEAASIEPGYTS